MAQYQRAGVTGMRVGGAAAREINKVYQLPVRQYRSTSRTGVALAEIAALPHHVAERLPLRGGSVEHHREH